MTICYHYHFHPVGQGLFASGSLYEANRQHPRFLWVYDCGSATLKLDAIWNCKVCDLQRFTHDKKVIDLMTLSHFDEDHITGVAALMSQFEVETLLLPYAPLWDRLEEAFSTGMALDSEAMRYALNPVGFLREQGVIRRVILVMPSEGEGPEPPNGPGIFPDGPWKLGGRTKKVPEDDDYAQDFGMTEEVELLLPGANLSIEALWEFVPYNRPRRDVRPEFVAEVKRRREALLHGPEEDRENVLKGLKSYYEAQIAKNGRQRNNISLFLYAGPVYATWDVRKLLYQHGDSLMAYPSRPPCYCRKHSTAPGIRDQCSILYSGDGYLNTKGTYNQLEKYLGAGRLGSLAVFQVNHHGAKGNWKEGLAAKLRPHISVFSSDPARGNTYHPHAEVLRDFWTYHPVQVNKIGHSSGGWLCLNQQAAADSQLDSASEVANNETAAERKAGETDWNAFVTAAANESNRFDIM